MQRKLIEAVAELFGVSYADLVGSSRQHHIALARQAAAWVLRQACPTISLQVIGSLLGGRDHTTIIYSIQQMEARMRTDPDLAADLRLLLPARPAAASRKRRRPQAGAAWWVAQSRERWEVLVA